MRLLGRFVLGALLLAGCTPTRSVLVQLVSNMAPGREIDSATVTIANDGAMVGTTSVELAPTASLGRPVRLASYLGLGSGRYDVVITLRRNGDVVQTRHIVREVDGATVVTALMVRECNGVACPGTGDPSAEACLGGRCVQPECDEEHPELCPRPECTVDGDCAMTTVSCAPARCSASGTCFARPDDALCAGGQLCDSVLGCIAVGADAGPVIADAGHDAGADAGHDAGADAGTPACTTHCRLDANGDGFGDFIVGASSEASATGAAYLVLGAASGPHIASRFTTGTANERIGFAVANLHDTNGDGLDDFLVSGHNAGGGHAYLFLGRATWPAIVLSSATIGAAGSSEFGQFMAGVGDIDGDGLADAVVSEDVRSLSHLFLGQSGTGLAATPAASTMPPDLFGTYAPGDLDGDGAGDLALPGQLLSNEHVYLFFARGGRFDMATPSATLTCPAGPNVGYGVLGSADVNGDRHIDLLVGASADGTGAVYVYLARTGAAPMLAPVTRVTGTSGFGEAVAGIGDIDGDGFEDVAVATDVTTSARVVILRGSATGLLSPTTSSFTLPAATGRTTVKLDATDVDGDGDTDLIVGDPIQGQVLVVRGPLTASTLGTLYTISVPGTNLGAALATH